jgi:hypothetical protein
VSREQPARIWTRFVGEAPPHGPAPPAARRGGGPATLAEPILPPDTFPAAPHGG